MSLYNMVNGFNPACIFILPLLGRKSEDYPRFRDCFVNEKRNIEIYTRVGGGNRNCGYGEEELYKDENFIKTYDDDFDSTYATYEFKVPDNWKEDFNKVTDGYLGETSSEYQQLIRSFYPILNENGYFDKVFEKKAKEE